MMDGAPVTEDCLCLNLWTSGVGDDGRRPVMVWLHGGGFNLNSASAPAFHGANLARGGDVVVIGINHRLNAFGFTDLSEVLGEPYRFSGNAGMLDIVAALQWVRDNVAQFGGDPGNVTLFGESGGGQKIATLLGMPAAQGLFHKAIIESAPGVGYLDRETAASIAAMLIEQAGGKDKLRTMSAQALVDAYQATASALQQKMPGRFGFVPVIDGVTLPRDPLLPDISPLAAHIPMMIGGNRDEINFFMLGRQKLDLSEAELLSGLRQRIPQANAPALVDICRAANPDATPWELFVLISSEAMTGAQTRGVADRKSLQPAPVHAYRFDWETPALGGHMGAFHGLEIPFVFNNLDRTREVVGMKPGMDRLATRMSAAWASFTHNAVPSAPGLPEWPAYGVPGRATMIFNDECRVENDPDGKLRAMLA
jgi:para-nitrobenzyl esterase